MSTARTVAVMEEEIRKERTQRIADFVYGGDVTRVPKPDDFMLYTDKHWRPYQPKPVHKLDRVTNATEEAHHILRCIARLRLRPPTAEEEERAWLYRTMAFVLS